MSIEWKTVIAFVVAGVILLAITPYITKAMHSTGAWEGLEV